MTLFEIPNPTGVGDPIQLIKFKVACPEHRVDMFE